MVVDIILGNTAAWINKEVDSDIGLRGSTKHVALLSFIILFLPSLSQYLGHNTTSISLMMYFIYQYMFSIVENFDKLGFKMPDFLVGVYVKARYFKRAAFD